MAKYFFTNKAVEDLTKIWEYTCEVWSENQAEKYYYDLLNDCQELAENQALGKNYEEISQEIYGHKSGQHLIFYRIINPSEIEITRISHSKMNLRNRIHE